MIAIWQKPELRGLRDSTCGHTTNGRIVFKIRNSDCWSYLYTSLETSLETPLCRRPNRACGWVLFLVELILPLNNKNFHMKIWNSDSLRNPEVWPDLVQATEELTVTHIWPEAPSLALRDLMLGYTELKQPMLFPRPCLCSNDFPPPGTRYLSCQCGGYMGSIFQDSVQMPPAPWSQFQYLWKN